MKPWRMVATAIAPGGADLVLWQRDAEFVVRVDGADLMSSRRHGSEEALAVAAGPAITRVGARVLVGGLGFGFTLRSALDRLGVGGHIRVAELSSDIIAWNQRFLGHLAGRPTEDARVAVECVDVRLALARASSTSPQGAYDAVLMDVDNGPWPLVTEANRGLWQREGLATLRASLRPGGTAVIWSAGPDPRFASRLRAAGLAVDVRRVREERGRGAHHTLFVAHWRG